METTTISPSVPPAPRVRPLAAVRRVAGRWGLIAALAALPVYYGIHDLVYGYQVAIVAGQPVIHHDLSIWASTSPGPVQRRDLGL